MFLTSCQMWVMTCTFASDVSSKCGLVGCFPTTQRNGHGTATFASYCWILQFNAHNTCCSHYPCPIQIDLRTASQSTTYTWWGCCKFFSFAVFKFNIADLSKRKQLIAQLPWENVFWVDSLFLLFFIQILIIPRLLSDSTLTLCFVWQNIDYWIGLKYEPADERYKWTDGTFLQTSDQSLQVFCQIFVFFCRKRCFSVCLLLVLTSKQDDRV